MGCTIAVNRALLDGVLHDDYPGMEMHDWWVVLYAETFGEIIHVPEKLMKYRQHSDNEVGAKDLKSMKYISSHLNGKMLRENCGNLLAQAKGFFSCYGDQMTPKNAEIFRDFYTLREKKKLSRIMTQLKGGYLKSTAARVIGQLLSCRVINHLHGGSGHLHIGAAFLLRKALLINETDRLIFINRQNNSRFAGHTPSPRKELLVASLSND